MPTTEEARPGLVLPEYGPTAAQLVRRELSPRGRRVFAAVVALVVLALAIVIARSGDGLTRLEHRSKPVFTMLYPPDQVRRVAPGAGELVRLRSGRGKLQMTVTVRRLRLPPYRGSVAGLLPIYADRQTGPLAAELPGFRALADGKARVNKAPGYQLRYRAGPRGRRVIGTDIYLVPEDGDRHGVLLRYRQVNPPRALREPDRDLVKTTRKAFRSLHFGLDRS